MIEALNRNQQISMLRSSRTETPQDEATLRQERFEAELQRMREEAEQKRREAEADSKKFQIDEEDRERIIAMKRLELDATQGHEKLVLVEDERRHNGPMRSQSPPTSSPAPSRTDLYSTRGSHNGESKTDEKASTQPFSPRSNSVKSAGDGDGLSSMTGTAGFGVMGQGQTNVSVEQRSALQGQETVDEIEELSADEKNDSNEKEDFFNF